MTIAEREALARKRVKAKKSFYNHLASYLSVAAFFFILNFLTSPGDWWFYWPMLGWGIGLASHYLKVFGLPGSGAGSSEWEEKELAKERKRLGAPASSESPAIVNMDEHLELRELEPESQKEYRREDLV